MSKPTISDFWFISAALFWFHISDYEPLSRQLAILILVLAVAGLMCLLKYGIYWLSSRYKISRRAP